MAGKSSALIIVGLLIDANDSELLIPDRHGQNVWGIAIGRRNWLHLGSKEAGPKIAAIFSIVESCRKLGVPSHPPIPGQNAAPGLPIAPSKISPAARQLPTPQAWQSSLPTARPQVYHGFARTGTIFRPSPQLPVWMSADASARLVKILKSRPFRTRKAYPLAGHARPAIGAQEHSRKNLRTKFIGPQTIASRFMPNAG